MPDWTIVPSRGELTGDAFTHIVAYFESKSVLYPDTPPPRGVVIRVDVDRVTIRCPEWGTAYFWNDDTGPFVEYLRQLPVQASKFLVAAVHAGDAAPFFSTPGVHYFPELALWLGAPQVPIDMYDSYPHKTKPHRILIPEGFSKELTLPGRVSWECDVDDMCELFPNGIPNP